MDGKNMMKANVIILKDSSVTRRVVLSDELKNPQFFCIYTTMDNGFPCRHGAAIIC